MRSERRSKTIPALAEKLEEMETIIEHNRSNAQSRPGNGSGRKVRDAIAVVVFEEEDGSETVSVVGNSDVGELELKGVLHDGLYAMTHLGEEDFSPE